MMTRMLLMLVLLISLPGCKHVRVVSADRQVHRMKAGKEFKPTCDGWFVPDATWKDINTAAEIGLAK